VAFRLVGAAKGPRDATGAAVWVTAGKLRQRGDVLSGGSFASSSDPRVHFGLGAATAVDAVEIRWPGGASEKIVVPAVDRIYTIEQGRGITGELCVMCAREKPAGKNGTDKKTDKK
jgi:hypothetical protein